MADGTTRSAIAYPRDAGYKGQMSFHSMPFGFSIAVADNGLIFEEYDVSDDTVRRKLASTPAQAQAIFDKWAAERSAEILKRAAKYFEELEA